MPIVQYHPEFNFHRKSSRDRTPWNIAQRHSRPDVLTQFRRWAQLRERLVRYLQHQTHARIAAGLPLIRANGI
jgi:alpha-glucosidase (family GH31 glycosyl hydrolase)